MHERLSVDIQRGCNPETGCSTDVVDSLLTSSRDGEITFRDTKRLIRDAMGAILQR